MNYSLVLALICLDVAVHKFTTIFPEEKIKQLIFNLISIESLIELLIFLSVTVGLCLLWSWFSDIDQKYHSEQKKTETLQEELIHSRTELEQHILKFKNHINLQFDAWGLSQSEKDICFLLLQGMSIKEIATHRSTSESTVRNQASALYIKSKLSGRSELSAFFMQELLSK